MDRSQWPERITIKIASEIFGLAESTLFRRMQQGKLPKMRKDNWLSVSHWLASELPDDLGSERQPKNPCPKCGKGLKRRGGAAPVKYYACTSCDYHCKHILETDEWVFTTKEAEHPFPPCGKCGGKIGKSSHNRQNPRKYARCKVCNQSWKMDILTGVVSESCQPTAKPKQPKAKPVAKTIRQDYTEKLKEMRDKKARQLVGKVAQPVDKAAIEQKKRFREIEERIAAQKTERDLYGWD